MERRGSGLKPSKDSMFSGATYDKVSRLDLEKLRRRAINFALRRKATIKDLALVRKIRSKGLFQTRIQKERFLLMKEEKLLSIEIWVKTFR